MHDERSSGSNPEEKKEYHLFAVASSEMGKSLEAADAALAGITDSYNARDGYLAAARHVSAAFDYAVEARTHAIASGNIDAIAVAESQMKKIYKVMCVKPPVPDTNPE